MGAAAIRTMKSVASSDDEKRRRIEPEQREDEHAR
jgi:hypothetical protein